MNWTFFLKAHVAVRYLLLVISISLALFPVSNSHAVKLDTIGVAHGQQTLEPSAEKIAESDCDQHVSKPDLNHEHGLDSCCKAACASFAMTVLVSISMPTYERPTYRAFGSSALLPGEYPTPHRPPNA